MNYNLSTSKGGGGIGTNIPPLIVTIENVRKKGFATSPTPPAG